MIEKRTGDHAMRRHFPQTSVGATCRRRGLLRGAAMGVVATATCALGSASLAATFTWNGTTPTNWSDVTAAGWNGTGTGSYPKNMDDVANITTNITADTTITLDVADATVGSLTLTDTTSSNNWVIAGANPLTFDVTSGSATITSTSSGPGLAPYNNISAAVVLKDPLSIAATNSSILVIQGNISESGGAKSLTIDATNTGIVGLLGNNSFSGGVTLNAGILSLNTSTAPGTGTLTINGGALNASPITLTNNNLQTWAGDFALNVGTLNMGTGAVTLSGGTRQVTTNPSTALSINGVIGDGGNVYGLTKAGAGTMVLAAANTYAGATTINAGVLEVATLPNGGSPSVLGQSSSAASNLVLGGGTLRYTGGTTSTDRNFTLTAATTSAIEVSTTATNLTMSGASAATAGALTKTGAGTLTLTGSNAHTGATTVNAGVLSVSTLANGGSPSNIGQSSSAASNLMLGGGTFRYTGGTTSIDRNFTLTTATTSTIDVSTGATNLTISGASAATTGALTKAGTGTLTLAGVNAHTGNTRVAAGALVLEHNNALASSTLDMNVSDTGTLSFGTLTSATLGGLQGPRNLSLQNASSAAVALSVGNNNQSTFYNGVLSGSGSLNKIGTGTLTLVSANTYAGATTIASGTLTLANNPPAALFTNNLQVQLDASSLTPGAITTWTNPYGGGNFNGNGTVQAGGPAFNSLNVVHFNGSQILTNSTVGYADETIFYVGALDGTQNMRLVGGLAGGTNWLMGYWNGNKDTAYSGAFVGAGLGGQGVIANTATHLYELTRSSGGNVVLYSNGATLGTGTGGQLTGLSLGGSFGENSHGSLGEVLVYNAVLSAAERAQVEAYLSQKWFGTSVGIGNLPTTTAVSFTGAGTLNLNNVNQTIASLASAVGGSQVTLGSATLTTGDSSNTSFAGSISGSGALVKQGSGTFTLAGNNSYAGTTAVNAGTLLVNGTHTGGGLYTVGDGTGTDILGGNVTINAAINVAANGVLAPGNSPGILTANGNVSIAGSLSVELQGSTAGTGYDQLLLANSGTYNVTLSGTLTDLFSGSGWSNAGDKLWIINNQSTGTLSGVFSNFPTSGQFVTTFDGKAWQIYYNANFATQALNGGNDVVLTAVPEPGTLALVLLGVCATFSLRRRRRRVCARGSF